MKTLKEILAHYQDKAIIEGIASWYDCYGPKEQAVREKIAKGKDFKICLSKAVEPVIELNKIGAESGVKYDVNAAVYVLKDKTVIDVWMPTKKDGSIIYVLETYTIA